MGPRKLQPLYCRFIRLNTFPSDRGSSKLLLPPQNAGTADEGGRGPRLIGYRRFIAPFSSDNGSSKTTTPILPLYPLKHVSFGERLLGNYSCRYGIPGISCPYRRKHQSLPTGAFVFMRGCSLSVVSFSPFRLNDTGAIRRRQASVAGTAREYATISPSWRL